MRTEIMPTGILSLIAEHPLERGLLKRLTEGFRISSTHYPPTDLSFYRDYPSSICLEATEMKGRKK